MAALRSKVFTQQVRSISGGKKMMEYFFQGSGDSVVKKMHNLQFLSGGWLEGTNQWGLIWRQTKKANNSLSSDLKCSAGREEILETKHSNKV